MSEIAVLSRSPEVSVSPVSPRGRVTSTLVAVFVMSFASLLLELSLTRVFSVILYYHFAFLVVSIALFGLGAGGVFAYIWKEQLTRWEIHTLGWALSAANAAVIVIVLLFVLRIPVSMQLSVHNLYRLTAIYLLSAVPFFLTGLLFSVVFARDTSRIGRLYGADLVGGAVACLAIVALLNSVGGPNTVLASATGMAVAATIWASTVKQRSMTALLMVILLTLLSANHAGGVIDIVYAKGLREAHEFARWNAISRVTVDQRSDYKWITIDSSANTPLMNVPPHGWKGTAAETSLMSQPAAAVNVLRPNGEFAIIGPGGGIDVLRAVGSGSARVTGIEINPVIANTLMRGKYADESYHLYEMPEVRMQVGDGRSWVRGSREQFEVIQMTAVDTWAATVAGALALSENNLYTVEAFREYFDHLKPDGILAITRWELKRPQEALRVVSVAMEALHQLGVRETASHFILVSDRPLDNPDNQAASVLVMAKKSRFTAEEEAAVRAHVLKYPPLEILYSPSTPTQSVHAALIASNDPSGFARRYEFDVSPVTDTQPFFFFTTKLDKFIGNPNAFSSLGLIVLALVMLVALIAVQTFLILPLWLKKENKPNRAPLLYFVAVGLGYILVEIAFIQRFVLFLGHPTYAFTVVVFLLLLSSGIGSLVSHRWRTNCLNVRIPLLVISAVLILYVAALPRLLPGLVGHGFGLRLLVSALMLMPLGFFMGIPFPCGLRLLARSGENIAEWAWAMNSCASVLGSVLAMMIAIEFGLNVLLGCAVAAYLAAALASSALVTRHNMLFSVPEKFRMKSSLCSSNAEYSPNDCPKLQDSTTVV